VKLKSVLAKLGHTIPDDHLNAVVLAGLVDMKYHRSMGGYKADNHIDMIAQREHRVTVVSRSEELNEPSRRAAEIEYPMLVVD